MKKLLALVLCLAMVLSTLGTVAFANETVDTWDGTIDIDWYDETKTVYTITTA